jgi:hypothetical protein
MTPQQQRLVAQINQALAVDDHLWTLPDILERARDRRMQIFHRDDAMVISEVLATPQRKRLNVLVAAGNLRSIIDMEPEVIQFARDEGADSMLTHGRPAWARIGRRLGWTLHSWCYVKQLGAPGALNGGGHE